MKGRRARGEEEMDAGLEVEGDGEERREVYRKDQEEGIHLTAWQQFAHH